MATSVERLAETLQDAEIVVLKTLAKSPHESKELAKKTLLDESQVSRAGMWLQNKALIEVRETPQSFAVIEKLGETYAKDDLPERKFIEALKKEDLLLDKIAEKAKLDKREMQFAFGTLKKKNTIAFEHGKVGLVDDKILQHTTYVEDFLKKLSKEKEIELAKLKPDEKSAFEELKARGLVSKSDRKIREFSITELGKQVASAIKSESRIGLLTPSAIKTGSWKGASFRRYDVEAGVPKIYPGKKQAYKAFIDEVKETLVGMGFEEMEGPLVEMGFFNNDALYMPQDHAARGIHDLYFTKEPKYGNLENYKRFVDEVKKTHESGGKSGSTGWQTKFDEKESSRLVLRSQGTAISARMLMNPALKNPGAYFSVARVFRPDKVDATHLTEFNQMEGIVLGDKLNFRHLLGLFEEFAKKIVGSDKIKFMPAYFPFTEPSVQTMIFHPKLNKWIEVMPGGMFRPELTEALGIKVPVLAWGIGFDRLFMIKESIADIRQLFSQDIEWLREAKI
ncbi:MAG TPA: phenylalanine--tRNA ligase subunit alpha [Nanoarchaeota archaeon]|nr:phenylalanine--tRNA ligase subunit alpha [Nanoarchaeota archaeon]